MTVNTVDFRIYSENAIDSIQESIGSGNHDSAHVQLCEYLLEAYSRFQSNEIDQKTYKESLRFYLRMTLTLIDESSINNQ